MSPDSSQDLGPRNDGALDQARTPPIVLLAVVLVALALRAWEAAESSLWLDELHTLSHASQPTWSALFEQVRLERVHVPLFFAFTRLFGGWEQGAWLRWIPVVFSVLTLLPLWSLTRSALGSPRAAALVVWLFACLPYQVHWGAELRPYAWWAAFSAGAAWAAFTEDRSLRWRTLVFFLCALAGIWTHRMMAITVFSIGCARVVVRSPRMVPLWRLIVAGTIAFAPMIMWALQFAQRATADRLSYQEQVGGMQLRTALLKEFLALPLRLLAPYLGALGGMWAQLAKVGVVLFLLAALGGVARRIRLRQRWAPLSAPLRALCVFALAHFVVVIGLSWWTWDRLPLQYFTPVAWTLPILLVALLGDLERQPRSTLAALCGAALLLGIAQAGGAGSEDMRGAVQQARQIGAQLDRPIYTGLLSQPSLFEDGIPYRAYGRDLDFREHAALPKPGDADFSRPIVVLRRGNIPVGTEPWTPLLDGRRVLREQKVDAYLTVIVLGPTP